MSASEQMESESYLLPLDDREFLQRDEMRSLRIALEFAKVDLILRDWHIRSTIIVFGSSQVPPPEQLSAADALASGLGSMRAKQYAWYESAREFGRIASLRGGALNVSGNWRDNVIATGGGTGLMEAANRGAHEAGAPTIGFNIELPSPQLPNPYTTPGLTFCFHYFAMRKMHLAMRANALVIFPGGFGTLDELFEILTLQQTEKTRSIPIVLYDRAYWRRIIDFDALTEMGMLAPEHRELFEYADTPEEAWRSIFRRSKLVCGGIE